MLSKTNQQIWVQNTMRHAPGPAYFMEKSVKFHCSFLAKMPPDFVKKIIGRFFAQDTSLLSTSTHYAVINAITNR